MDWHDSVYDREVENWTQQTHKQNVEGYLVYFSELEKNSFSWALLNFGMRQHEVMVNYVGFCHDPLTEFVTGTNHKDEPYGPKERAQLS